MQRENVGVFFLLQNRNETRRSIYYNWAKKKTKYLISLLGMYSKRESIGNYRLYLDLTV